MGRPSNRRIQGRINQRCVVRQCRAVIGLPEKGVEETPDASDEATNADLDPSTGKGELATKQALLEAAVPMELTSAWIRENGGTKVVWNYLRKEKSWRWKAGSGLVGFTYFRPGLGSSTKCSNHIHGIDYFNSEDELVDVVMKILQKRQEKKANDNRKEEELQREMDKSVHMDINVGRDNSNSGISDGASKSVKRKIREMTSDPTQKSGSNGERPRVNGALEPSHHRYNCDEDEENVSHKNKKVQEVKSVSPGPVIVNISDKASSFIAATASGDINHVKNDLKANPDLINCTDRDGMTALAWASMKNYMDIVELLLTYEDCQLDRQDRFGTTGLILACCSGHIEIAIKLIQLACNHTVRDGKGKSAYDYLRNLHPTKCTSFLDALKV